MAYGLPSWLLQFLLSFMKNDRIKFVPVPYEKARVVILPVLWTSSLIEQHDEDLEKEFRKIGVHTMPVLDEALDALYNATRRILQDGKFQVTLGGDPAITSTLVKAHLEKWPSLAVLQIGSRVVEQCPVVQVGDFSVEEIQSLPKSKNKIFSIKDPDWYVKVVDELPEHVYFTIEEIEEKTLMDLTQELTYRRNVVGLDFISCQEMKGAVLFEILRKIFE
jgi:hypothetical protein